MIFRGSWRDGFWVVNGGFKRQDGCEREKELWISYKQLATGYEPKQRHLELSWRHI